MIKDNPFLGPEWEPLGLVISSLLDDLKRGSNFHVQTYGKRYGLSPHTSPYVQAAIFDRKIQLEVAGNLMVRPELTTDDFAALEFYGWFAPLADDELDVINLEREPNPNFSRFYSMDTDSMEIAEFILSTLIGVYQITKEDMFGFPGHDRADRVAALRKLGRIKRADGNPDGEIFAMPGENRELLEFRGCMLEAPIQND